MPSDPEQLARTAVLERLRDYDVILEALERRGPHPQARPRLAEARRKVFRAVMLAQAAGWQIPEGS